MGLAAARRWIHVRDLREDLDSDEPHEPRAELMARQAAQVRAQYRSWVERWLEQEKKDPTLRNERSSMLSWTGSTLVDKRECIFDALLEVGECMCRASGSGIQRSCEMCRADAEKCVAGAGSGQRLVPPAGSCELVLPL